MAVVKWRKKAWELLNSYVENARIEYGETTARKWTDSANSNTVYIRDVWDTKLNPNTLRNRLK